MSWEALGAIGETIGAIAVVLTLAYLALQIRQNSRQIDQNTQSLRLAAAHGWKSDGQDLRMRIVQDAEIARILRLGLADASLSDENDRVRFNIMLAAIFDHLQFAFERRGEGLLDWDALERFIRGYLSQPGTRNWWRSGRETLNEAFVSYVEERLLPSSDGSGPYWAPTPAPRGREAGRP